MLQRFAAALVCACGLGAAAGLTGRVLDPQGRPVPGAVVRLDSTATSSDESGRFRIEPVLPGRHQLTAEAPGFERGVEDVTVSPEGVAEIDITLGAVAVRRESIVVRGDAVPPAVATAATRDDQLIQQLNSGIDAGQHEGGGKSLEIRRFGFNLDHGGVNGGLAVLVDGVQQNQATQGHGQGYLGSLKALSPELIQDVTVINGPFSAEYGDFSGLGVVQIHQRESLPDQFTARLAAGNFASRRAFLGYSPDARRFDAYLAYEGTYSDGPFQNPGRYRRDNVNANLTVPLNESEQLGFRFLFGRNNFDSSGQLPLDLVAQGALDRFGYIDPTDGGRVKLGTASAWYSRVRPDGDTWKTDTFVSRSLFDLFSDFTFFRDDPVHGDAFQQHDSRLQEGLNTQYVHPHHVGSSAAVLVAGGNFHDNQINVGLYPRQGRVPTGVTTRAYAHVTDGASYARESVSLLGGRLVVGAGLRYDTFRFAIAGVTEPAGRWQPKAGATLTPSRRLPLTLTANYGRGINSSDARGVIEHPELPRVATTNFYQVSALSTVGRVALSVDAFLIDHSNEQVYIPDDGSFEFKGPSRAYGYEAKGSLSLTRHVSLNGGVTKIANAFYRGGSHRVYVDSAPHFVADAALTVSTWRGWTGSLRMRAANHYRLDGEDPSIVASGHTVFDATVAKRLRRGIELNLSLDNVTDRDYYETQNYFESRTAPGAPVLARIHGTPGYPLAAMAGATFRFGGK